MAGFAVAVCIASSASAQVPDQILKEMFRTMQQHVRPFDPGTDAGPVPYPYPPPQKMPRIISSSRPTINCSNVQSPLGHVLCNDEMAAKGDWDVNAAAWAHSFSLEDVARKAFWKKHDEWVQSVTTNCRLTQAISEEGRRCVVNAYRARAKALQARLTGDALAEAQLAPEQRAKIQERLVSLGYLSDEPDAEFGPNTRAGIRLFQQANGFPESTYLTVQQRQVLLASGEVGDSREQNSLDHSQAQRLPTEAVGPSQSQAQRYPASELLPVKVSAFDKKFNEIAARTSADVRAVPSGCGEMVGLPKGLRRCNYNLGDHSTVMVVGPTEEGDALGIEIRSKTPTEHAQMSSSIVIITEIVAPERSVATRESVVQELLRDIERVKLTPPTLVCQDLGGSRDGSKRWVLSGSDYYGDLRVRIVRPLSGDCPRGIGNLQDRTVAIQEDEERREAEANRPINVLGNAYASYIFLRRCRATREGYLVIYISESELERSRQAVKHIEEALKPKLGPDEDINQIWAKANDHAYRLPVELDGCKSAYASLTQRSKAIAPEENYLDKDF